MSWPIQEKRRPQKHLVFILCFWSCSKDAENQMKSLLVEVTVQKQVYHPKAVLGPEGLDLLPVDPPHSPLYRSSDGQVHSPG